MVVTAQILQEHPSKKKKLQLGSCKLLVFLATSGGAQCLKPTFYPTKQHNFFVAVSSPTCFVSDERLDWNAWLNTKESAQEPEPPDHRTTTNLRGNKTTMEGGTQSNLASQ